MIRPVDLRTFCDHEQDNRALDRSMADHEQDWQPYPVDPYSCYGTCDNNIYIDIYIYTYIK